MLASPGGAKDRGGGDLGRVRAVHDFGAGTVLEIEGLRSGPHMVPFTRDAVPVVDVAAGRIVIAPVAGLFDPAPDNAEDGASGEKTNGGEAS